MLMNPWLQIRIAGCDHKGRQEQTQITILMHPWLHQNGDLWLLLATFVITACYVDLNPGVHQNNDVWLLLAAFVITACYAEQKPGMLILAAAGNLRPQDLKITPKRDPKTAPRAQRNPKKDPQRPN